MTVTLYTSEGMPLAGDAYLDSHMKHRCDEIGGYVKDDATDQTIYPVED